MRDYDAAVNCPICGDDTYEIKSGPVQVVSNPEAGDRRNTRTDLSCGCIVRSTETYYPETGWI